MRRRDFRIADHNTAICTTSQHTPPPPKLWNCSNTICWANALLQAMSATAIAGVSINPYAQTNAMRKVMTLMLNGSEVSTKQVMSAVKGFGVGPSFGTQSMNPHLIRNMLEAAGLSDDLGVTKPMLCPMATAFPRRCRYDVGTTVVAGVCLRLESEEDSGEDPDAMSSDDEESPLRAVAYVFRSEKWYICDDNAIAELHGCMVARLRQCSVLFHVAV